MNRKVIILLSGVVLWHIVTVQRFVLLNYKTASSDEMKRGKDDFISQSVLSQDCRISNNEQGMGNKRVVSSDARRVPNKERDRLAIISYVPGKLEQLIQFKVFLYGSWRFIVEHQSEFFPGDEFNEINDLDLLVFCHASICRELDSICSSIKGLDELNTKNSLSKCWAVEQQFQDKIPYGAINSFIMFERTDIRQLIPLYKYTLRTDNDVFITPNIYQLKSQVFLFGHGGYSHSFNKERLKMIAKLLGKKHRGIHSIGSTWFGDTTFFIKAAKMTLNVTRYIFNSKFNPKNKWLKSINFKSNDGKWPEWWRPVSLLYGGEIALNHLIKNISDKNKGKLDSYSCHTTSIWKTPHIHCWHNNCEFSKFKFMKHLKAAILSKGSLPSRIVNRVISNNYIKNITAMNLREYSEFIAWTSAMKYLKKLFIY